MLQPAKTFYPTAQNISRKNGFEIISSHVQCGARLTGLVFHKKMGSVLSYEKNNKSILITKNLSVCSFLGVYCSTTVLTFHKNW
jgi:hypothetical protein